MCSERRWEMTKDRECSGHIPPGQPGHHRRGLCSRGHGGGRAHRVGMQQRWEPQELLWNRSGDCKTVSSHRRLSERW